ncbi:phosphoserine phosphatase SerB [Helicobacter sp. 11S02629-2]|uniref:phosphoserine phosphatase SerB n=1 Tax=Helicobacter sp. 11S02629-2 TaxID=1476195 RepID=UPI000BA5C63D|nr:phosphoserine phosphatase SerB [Helicobacter sp. 11S02629-2]PAF44342.1 phosphoserine phosphatase SerB [Helicobacter sp. 11S02629-2]
MKLVVFDFDGTLMDNETIDELAAAYSINDEVSLITKEAMEGKIDFFSALTKRVALLKGMPLSLATKVAHSLTPMPNAKECIDRLKEAGFIVVCFSGGFSLATEYFKEVLGLDATFSNILHAKDCVLTGQVGGSMMFSDSKGVMLKSFASMLGLSKSDCIAIGDGANDLSMFEYADTRIAFCAKPKLKEKATHIVDTKDLGLIADIVLQETKC